MKKPPYSGQANILSIIDADFYRELAEIEAESIGWQPLEPGTYLHVGDQNALEIMVVGVPQAGPAVLLVLG